MRFDHVIELDQAITGGLDRVARRAAGLEGVEDGVHARGAGQVGQHGVRVADGDQLGELPGEVLVDLEAS